MSFESQQRGLLIDLVSRKRDRSPSSEREKSVLLAPTTPPATERKRVFDDDEEENWGLTTQEWGHIFVSETHAPLKKSRVQPSWAQDHDLIIAYQDLDDAILNFAEESPSPLPFVMSTFDSSAEESGYNISTQSGAQSEVLTLSWEDIEDLTNGTAATVTSLPSTPRPADRRSIIVQPAQTTEDLQSRHPEDEESSKHYRSNLFSE